MNLPNFNFIKFTFIVVLYILHQNTIVIMTQPTVAVRTSKEKLKFEFEQFILRTKPDSLNSGYNRRILLTRACFKLHCNLHYADSTAYFIALHR